MRRVIFITDLEVESLGSKKGGRAFYNTLCSYLDSGWEVMLITTGGNVPPEFRGRMKVYEQKSDYNPNQGGCKVVRLLKRYRHCQKIGKFYCRTAAPLLEEGASLLYAYETGGVKVAKKLSKKYRVPLVTRFQGTWFADIPYTWVNRFRFFPNQQALHTEADLVIMTNDGTRGDEALKKCKNTSSQIKFWMNGVNVPSNEHLEKRKTYREQLGVGNKFVFLTVSRLESWKRVDRAISALASMVRENSQAELHICGDGDLRTTLENLAKTLNVADRVVFHGAVPHEKVWELLIASDVFLSLYDLSNVGNPLLEAMGAGKPVITIDNGDTKRFVEDGVTGCLLPKADVSLIAGKMTQLFSDKNLVESMGRNARSFATTHFWSWQERMQAEQKEVAALLKVESETSSYE